MEPQQFVPYQVAISATIADEKSQFFSLVADDTNGTNPDDESSHLVTKADLSNTGRRISTLSFDPSKIPKGFVKKEPVDADAFLTENQSASSLYDENGLQYVCATCNQSFNCHISLQSHLKIHVVKNEHAYSEDDIAIYDADQVFDAESIKKYFKCPVCNKSFYTEFNLNSHMKIHAGETPFYCSLCDKRFTHGKNLHKHIQRAHNQDHVNATSLYAKLLRGMNPSENKLVVYTGEPTKPYKCAICSKSFRRLYRVKEHTRSHSGQKPFQCSVCGKTFSSSDILYRHIKRLHNGGNPLQSSVMDALKSAKVEEVDEHTTVIHVEEAPMNDPIQTNDINQVRFLHAPGQGEIVNVDSIVGANNFNSTSTYYIDLRTGDCSDNLAIQPKDEIATSEEAFQCSLCSKTFRSISLLNKHIMVHKVQVPSKCDICDKTFRLESYLKRHMRIHSGEKPFKCSLCPKAFYRPYRLSNHWRTHTGEKPYHCSVCSKSFSVSDNMYRHIRKMHKGEGLEYASDIVKQIQELNRAKKWQ